MSAFTNPQDAHFWVTIALIAFVIILWRVEAHSAVGRALDSAGERVRAQLDEAARLRAEAAAVLEEIKARRQETESAAARMLEAAKQEARRLREQGADRLEADIARRASLAEQRIATAEAQAAQEVKAAAADLAGRAAQSIFAERLAAMRHDPMIDAGLAELAERF